MNRELSRIAWIVVLLIGVFFIGRASASEITVQGGLQQTPNSNYGNGSEWVARYEQPLSDDFGLAVEGAYHGATSHNHDTGTYGDLSGWTLLGGPVYHLPVSWKLKPYILGMLGWGWWSFDRSQEMRDAGIEINMGDALAWKAGIGVDYAIGGNWSVNVEYFRFGSWVPKQSFYSSDGSFANVVTSDENLGQEENGFMLGLKYKW